MSTPHFSSPFNFGAIPSQLAEYKKSNVIILPVPYDATTSYKSGTRGGPRAIINASGNMELFDEETSVNISNMGICTLDELDVVVDPEKMVQRVYETYKQLLIDGKKVVMIGGEHSLSLGPVKALKEKYPAISVLCIDAHSDMASEDRGTKFYHGSVARRISEICPIVQVGVRSIAAEHIAYSAQKGIKIFYAADIAKSNDNKWVEEAISGLSEHVYVTIDLDALDTSIMPSVGTPEPGGLQWYTLLKLLRMAGEKKNVLGFDVMELCPVPGNVAPDYAAAKIIKKFIAYSFAKNYKN